MPTFASYDNVELAYDLHGTGAPLVMIPGGAGRDAAYLGDLDPLAVTLERQLVVLHPRGTGASRVPTDPAAYRADRLADDLLSLVDHLELDSAEILAHSAGANVALLFAAAHPTRVARLVLVTPGTRAVGLEVSDEEWEVAAARRSGEPWYEDGFAGAVEDNPTALQIEASQAFLYGRWDATAQAHAATDDGQRNPEATRVFNPGAYDTPRTVAALGALTAPVRILLGEYDLQPTPQITRQLAEMFPDAEVVVQKQAGHFPWLDDGDEYAARLARVLAS